MFATTDSGINDLQAIVEFRDANEVWWRTTPDGHASEIESVTSPAWRPIWVPGQPAR